MKTFKTEQEKFWNGEFGNEYVNRNNVLENLEGNHILFKEILEKYDLKKVIEFGPNIGHNLNAIKKIFPNIELSGVELNELAIKELRKQKEIIVYNESILNFKIDYQRDLVLIKTVLIHIDPTQLEKVYNLLFESSSKYICLVEYYNQTPTEVTYRGHSQKLFKRDFAGEMLDKFPSLKLVDYGFKYHRDHISYDDFTWFLLEK